MKKFLIIALLLCGVSAYSQGWKYGIEVGYTSNKFRTDLLDQRARNGFKIGGIVNYTFKNDVVVEAGIAFDSRNGTLDKKSRDGITILEWMSEVEVTETSYLNIPLSAGYKMKIGEKLTVTPQVGWFVNIGVDAHGEHVENYNGALSRDRIGDFFSQPNKGDSKSWNRIDTGPTLGVNLQYHKVRLKCYYELGINSAHGGYNRRLNDNTLGASVAYMF